MSKPEFDPAAAEKRWEAAIDVLDDGAFDAHMASCRDGRSGGLPFAECGYEPCVRRRYALIVANTDLPAALEALEEAKGALTDTMENVVEPLKMQRNSAELERDRALGELTASISEGHKWDEMYDKVIEARDEALRLLERAKPIVAWASMVVGTDTDKVRGIAGEDERKLAKEIEDCLANVDIPAAREAAAIAFIEEIRDGGWVVDITAQESAKQFLEAQTISPAAAALLAQGEQIERLETGLNKVVSVIVDCPRCAGRRRLDLLDHVAPGHPRAEEYTPTEYDTMKEEED